jgi:hypothetical protein
LLVLGESAFGELAGSISAHAKTRASFDGIQKPMTPRLFGTEESSELKTMKSAFCSPTA